jgi:hypothetical protein
MPRAIFNTNSEKGEAENKAARQNFRPSRNRSVAGQEPQAVQFRR